MQSGGALYAAHSAAVSSSRFVGCRATTLEWDLARGGGAVATGTASLDAGAGTALVQDSEFVSCASPWGWGGALRARALDIRRCQFASNSALRGGAASAIGSVATLRVVDSSFSGNSAAEAGGALHVDALAAAAATPGAAGSRRRALADIQRSAFAANEASGVYSAIGGAASFTDADARVASCTFDGNAAQLTPVPENSVSGDADDMGLAAGTAAAEAPPRIDAGCKDGSAQGGALAAVRGTITVAASAFTANAADCGAAAAVRGSGASLRLSGVSASGNTAAECGGAWSAQDAASLELSNSTLEANSARRGGGLLASHIALLALDGVAANANAALLQGGVAFLAHVASVDLRGSRFVGNSAAAGAVAFLHDLAPVPPCLGVALEVGALNGSSSGFATTAAAAAEQLRLGCVVEDNRADRYGAVVATEVSRAEVAAPAETKSGAPLAVSLTLFDGAVVVWDSGSPVL